MIKRLSAFGFWPEIIVLVLLTRQSEGSLIEETGMWCNLMVQQEVRERWILDRLISLRDLHSWTIWGQDGK